MVPQDPYVKVTMLPSQASAKTTHVSGGGVTPRWTHENVIHLPLRSDTVMRIELWNRGFTSNVRIGGNDLDTTAIIEVCRWTTVHDRLS